jgi:pyruvate/2-oxoglutarate dehydrogenase complex dihydrolipoamide dehydrogenase (E3) component
MSNPDHVHRRHRTPATRQHRFDHQRSFRSFCTESTVEEITMPQSEAFDAVILGSGQGGKQLAWHLAGSGRKVAVVERRWVGGSCPAVACMPSKNELSSARVAHLVRNTAHFGTIADRVTIDMERVWRRKQDTVEREIELHLSLYKQSGAELIMGTGRFIGPKTIEVALNDGGTRVLVGDAVVINVGSHAAVPDLPGIREAHPLTHIEALELDRTRRRLCWYRVGAGLPALRWSRDDHRTRITDHWTRRR